MKKSKYSQILDSLTDDQIPSNLDLAPKILNRIQKNKGAKMNTRMKVLVPILSVVVVLALITLTVPAVAQAIQRWFGYIPGFGLVEDGNVRVLEKPVTMAQDGVILTVTEIMSNSSKTLIKYSLTNIPADAFDDIFFCKGPEQAPSLELSDGNKPDLQGLGWDGGGGRINMEATFPGIPVEINEMTLELNCISGTKSGSIPWEWKVLLSLDSRSQASMTIAPVIEIPPSTEEPASNDAANKPEVNASLSLTRIIPLVDGYILSGSMTLDAVSGLTVDETDGYLENLIILDANGKSLTPLRVLSDFMIEGDGFPNNRFNWAVQITEKEVAWPLSVTVNSVKAITEPFEPSSFTVDVGQDPQSDQLWMLDQDVPLDSKMVRVVSLQRVFDRHGINGYEFTFIYDPSFEFSIQIEECELSGGGGQGSLEPGQPFTVVRGCANNPTGILKVILTGYGVEQIQGPWQVTVNEPNLP